MGKTFDYNPFMRQNWEISGIGRLLLVLAVIILLGITPQSHELSRQFQQVRQALGTGSSGDAARLTANIARQILWRSDLWERAGDYAWQADDFQSTITYLEQAAQLNDLSPEGRLRLVDACLLNGEVNKAERLLLDMLKDKSTNEIFIRLFQAHRLQMDYPAALTDIQALSELEPDNANLPYMAGLFQMILEPDRALSLLEQASSLNTNFEPTVSAIEGSLLLAQRSSDPVEALMTGGRILAALEEWELAGEAFRQATLFKPENAAVWAFLGETRQHTNGPASFYANLYPLKNGSTDSSGSQAAEDGLSDLQKALALDPRLTTGHVFLSLYWARHQQYELALDSIEDAINLQPEEAALYSQMGSIQAMLGDLSGALVSYQRAVELSEDDPQSLELLISFCITYEYQVREAAFPAARSLLQQDLKDPAALDLAGQILYLLNDPAAKKYLERALEQDSNYAPAHLHLGLLYLKRGEYVLAKDEFSLARSLAAGTPTGIQAQRLLETYFPEK